MIDQWLRQSGQLPININKRELRKQLYDDGLTHSTGARINTGFYDYQTKDPVNDKVVLVTALRIEDLWPEADSQEDGHETHEAHEF